MVKCLCKPQAGASVVFGSLHKWKALTLYLTVDLCGMSSILISTHKYFKFTAEVSLQGPSVYPVLQYFKYTLEIS